MPLQPVVRRSVPDEVFDQVLAEVVDGEIPVGDLIEHLVRHGTADHGLQRHAGDRSPAGGQRSTGRTSVEGIVRDETVAAPAGLPHPMVTDYRPPPGRTLKGVPAVLAPRLWWGHALALVLVAAAATLGWWQVEAWQERRDAEARDLTQADPVPLVDVLGPDEAFPADSVGQPVTLSGTWLGEGTVFVSGREHDGDDGYWMVTPLALDDEAAIPVVLGWVADPATAPAAPSGAADVAGWLQPSEGTGAVDDDPSDDVLPQLRSADLVQLVDRDLYGAYAVARDGIGGLPAADLAQLPEASRFTAVRNLLYGVEWWVFGGFAVFIWWRWVRDATRVPEDEPAPDSVAV